MLHILLERWAKLEPDRCEILKYENGFVAFRVGRSPMIIAPDREEPENWSWTTAVIQGAVQDAIVANGGDFIVECAVPPTAGFFARISKIGGDNYECECDRYGGIALLSAYLDWLEEELKPKELVSQSSSDEIPF